MKKKCKLLQLFCRHQPIECVNRSGPHGFVNISGHTVYIVCKKCGKIMSSYYVEYEGGGYK